MKTLYKLKQDFRALNDWQIGTLLFFLALAVRVAIIMILHPYRDLARYELERTAISLATTGVFGNPYAVPTGPTAHVSPGYTLILAALFRLFGTGIPAEIVKELLASAVTALQCALLPAVAKSLLFHRQTGTVSGLICALIPIKPFVQIDGDWESPYTALFLMVILAVTVQTWKQCKLTVPAGILQGMIWGLALLFASVLLPVFIALVVIGVYFCRNTGYRPYLRFVALEVFCVVLCLAPWTIRNAYALGAPVATRSNFGLELRVSNNDQATPDQRTNYLQGVYDRYHPLQNPKEALKVQQLGEVAYNKQVEEQTKSWIRTHMSRFLQLCAGRVRCFWLYPDPSRLKAVFGDLIAGLGLAGFALTLKRNLLSGAAIGAVLLLYPAPNYLIHVGARQRYPIDWLLTLLSVVLLMQAWEFWSVRRQHAGTGAAAF